MVQMSQSDFWKEQASKEENFYKYIKDRPKPEPIQVY